MTRFTVVWDSEVESHFIDTWVAGDTATRAVLTDVANLVDASLSEDPIQKGTPWSDQDAFIFVIPLFWSARARFSDVSSTTR